MWRVSNFPCSSRTKQDQRCVVCNFYVRSRRARVVQIAPCLLPYSSATLEASIRELFVLTYFTDLVTRYVFPRVLSFGWFDSCFYKKNFLSCRRCVRYASSLVRQGAAFVCCFPPRMSLGQAFFIQRLLLRCSFCAWGVTLVIAAPSTCI